jgi:hypothetical protein
LLRELQESYDNNNSWTALDLAGPDTLDDIMNGINKIDEVEDFML